MPPPSWKGTRRKRNLSFLEQTHFNTCLRPNKQEMIVQSGISSNILAQKCYAQKKYLNEVLMKLFIFVQRKVNHQGTCSIQEPTVHWNGNIQVKCEPSVSHWAN